MSTPETAVEPRPERCAGASSWPRRLLLTKKGVRLSFIAANHRESRQIRPESSYPLCHRQRWLRLNALGRHMAPSGGVDDLSALLAFAIGVGARIERILEH